MAYTFTNTSPYTIGNISISTPSSSVLLNGANGTSYNNSWNWTTASTSPAPVTISQSATIDLRGENADIVINGESLKETLQAIKDALKIPGRIQQNAKLEESFEELRDIREKYEQLLKDYKEKQQVWDTLKSEDI